MVRARKTPPDGRANNGGTRQGQPGQSYGNRTDLRVATAPGQEYGKAAAQARSQAAVPMSSGPPTPQVAPATAPPGAAPQGPMAGDAGHLLRPTERPDEPLTHGAPFGPGANSTPPAGDPTLAQLQAYYKVFPTQDLADLIEELMMQQGFGR